MINNVSEIIVTPQKMNVSPKIFFKWDDYAAKVKMPLLRTIQNE